MNVVGCSKQKHKCPQRRFWAGKNVPSHGIILGVALKFMKCQISRAESQDLIWKIKAWFCGLVLLNSLYKALILHLTRNLSPIWTQKEREQFVTFCIFVFVCDGLLNLLTFKPCGLYCSRYCTKHEACASRPHLNMTCLCFSSSSMIKTFIFYLNGELTGYQWFPQDIGSVQESGCIMQCEAREWSIDMWSSHNAPLLEWKELTVCTSVWERKLESLLYLLWERKRRINL